MIRQSSLDTGEDFLTTHAVTGVIEAFPFLAPLNAIPGVRAGWVERVPDLSITGGRDEAMTQLRPFHEVAMANFFHASLTKNSNCCQTTLPEPTWWRAEQVHGNAVATVPGSPQIIAPDGLPVVPGVDGLLTNQPATVLAIYVADCAAIWLADSRSDAIGLVHSGKMGTAGHIFQAALDQMVQKFGTRPQDVTAVLSPCIRPPDYDVDFATEICRQAERAGVGNFIDSGLNTASNLARFYSYRKELGKTGRMLALIVRDFPCISNDF